MSGTDTVPVRTSDLRTLRSEVARIRTRVENDVRMHPDDKGVVLSKCRSVEEILDRCLQLELFSPAQRRL